MRVIRLRCAPLRMRSLRSLTTGRMREDERDYMTTEEKEDQRWKERAIRRRIGRNLTTLRKRDGLTEKQLVEITGYTLAIWSKWLTGRSAPAGEKIVIINMKLGWKLGEIYNMKREGHDG